MRERVRIGPYVAVEDWNDRVGILRHRGHSYMIDGPYVRNLIAAAKGQPIREDVSFISWLANMTASKGKH